MLVDVWEATISDNTHRRGTGPRRNGDGKRGRNAYRFNESQEFIDITPFHARIDKKTWFVSFTMTTTLTGPDVRIPHLLITAILC